MIMVMNLCYSFSAYSLTEKTLAAKVVNYKTRCYLINILYPVQLFSSTIRLLTMLPSEGN